MRLCNGYAGLLALVLLFAAIPGRAQIYTQQVRFGSRGEGDGQFRVIVDIALDAQGNVYVADKYRVQKFDNNGKFVRKFGGQGNGDGQFRYLHGTGGVAVDPVAGYVYVSDWGNNRIHKFDRDGRFISTFGVSGKGNGQFKYPGPLATDRAGNLYVLDAGNGRVQKFDRNGRFLLKFGRPGDGVYRYGRYVLHDGEFGKPSDIAVDPAGNVYVAEALINRVQQFSSSGKFLNNSGDQPQGYQELHGTIKIAFDSVGNGYLAQRSVRISNRNGKLISQFSTANTSHKGPSGAAGIAVDAKGNVFVAYHDNDGTRVHKYRRRYLAP